MKMKVGQVSESRRAKRDDLRGSCASKKTPLSLIIIAVLVAIVTFMVFLPTLQNEFVKWDDDQYVFENPHIRSFDLTFFKWAFFDFYAANWHPVTWISHAVDYAVWGLNPLGHHLTSIIIHAINTFVVVLLVVRLMEAARSVLKKGSTSFAAQDKHVLIAAAATGLFFGLHPLHVESVSWVAERKDLLCALFYLLSVMMYLRQVNAMSVTLPLVGDLSGKDLNTGKDFGQTSMIKLGQRFFNKWYLLSLSFFTLALLSKPMAVSLPVVLLILDWHPFRRITSLKTLRTSVIEKLPFLTLSIVSSILTILAQKAGGTMELMQSVPLSTRLLVVAKSLIAYCGKMLFPLNLIPFYPYPENISPLSLEYIVPIVIVAGITVTCLGVMRKQKLWMAVWSYYVITLIPVLGIVQVGTQAMADRYTYLPSLGPSLIIGLAAATVYEKLTTLNRWRVISRIASSLIILAVLVSMSYATINQIGIWKDSLMFWSYVVKKEPERVPSAYIGLGNAYASNGQLDVAIEQYQTALRLKPDHAGAHANLGNAYASKGQLDMAIEQYQITLRLKPDLAEAHYNLGFAYQSKGQLDMAIGQYQTALRLKPDYAEAHGNLGAAYQSKGQLDMAIEQYQTALRLKPDYAEAHGNLGAAYVSKGLKNEAITELNTALELDPSLINVRHALDTLTR